MPRTTLTGRQISDGSVQFADIDTVTSGQALITKIVAGTNINITSTGVDPGTGNVTINASVSGSSAPHALTTHTDWPIGLTTTELNYSTSVTGDIQTQLNSKAPLTSPSFSGIPTAPTAVSGTNTTQIATTAFVHTAIENIPPTGTYATSASIMIGDLISTPASSMTIEQTGDMYGASRLILLNRNTLNGAEFQVDSIDLVDFIFSPSSRVSSNIRWEHRDTYLTENVSGQFEIGPADNEFLTLGYNLSTVHSKFVGDSTIEGTNLDINGFSTNLAVVKVYKAAAPTQAIGATSNTKITYNTIEITPTLPAVSGAWSSVNNRYTAPTSGIYYVSGTARTTGTNRSCKLMLWKGGIFYENLDDRNTTASSSSYYNGSTLIYLGTNQYIELWFYASSATTLAESNFCIHRIY